MAGRNFKEGLDFFPMDTSFFSNDKIQLIEAEFGLKGVMVAIRLLCKIYSEKGYYYQWGEDECLLFSRMAGAEFVPSAVKEIVNGLVRRRFFNKECFDRFGILTSHSIQMIYVQAAERRKNVELINEYCLLDKDEISDKIEFISINVDINRINVDINTKNDNSFEQSKVKESKGKENKEKEKEKKVFDFSFCSEDFLPSFELWLSYKKNRKESYKDEYSIKLLYEKLQNYSNGNAQTAMLVVEQSIANNWAGLFPLRAESQANNPQLGTDERIVNGIRTYGSGSVSVPLDAPPRPSERWWWNAKLLQWNM